MYKILILGGTNFIGRNLIERLSKNKTYDLTIFNRGITNPGVFPAIKKIIGDRNSSDVNLIHNTAWDYIIDLSCYYPQSLINILKGLTYNLKKYILISTCSVYLDDKVILGKESALIKNCNPNQFSDSTTTSYGNRKAECERIIAASKFNFTILRPDLVYGKYDPTDRLYYWLHQAKHYNQILVPNHGTSFFSLTYVDDLAHTIEKTMVKKEDREIYNITTVTKTSIRQILSYSSEVLGTNPQLVNANSQFLNKNNINEWTDMPVWIDSEYSNFDNNKILNSYHLDFTDFKMSIQKTINYYTSLGWPTPKYGINRALQINLIDQLLKEN
ncbi:MAG: hypothetical protein BM564_02965 [Bacteroidetes bacterium MedPE-SWsnd-G2]|nr:MAG: hypothetical protein BM564_02965 [Bacteroidetes bacterium MedPE-SWsnd-G2]